MWGQVDDPEENPYQKLVPPAEDGSGFQAGHGAVEGGALIEAVEVDLVDGRTDGAGHPDAYVVIEAPLVADVELRADARELVPAEIFRTVVHQAVVEVEATAEAEALDIQRITPVTVGRTTEDVALEVARRGQRAPVDLASHAHVRPLDHDTTVDANAVAGGHVLMDAGRHELIELETGREAGPPAGVDGLDLAVDPRFELRTSRSAVGDGRVEIHAQLSDVGPVDVCGPLHTRDDGGQVGDLQGQIPLGLAQLSVTGDITGQVRAGVDDLTTHPLELLDLLLGSVDARLEGIDPVHVVVRQA